MAYLTRRDQGVGYVNTVPVPAINNTTNMYSGSNGAIGLNGAGVPAYSWGRTANGSNFLTDPATDYAAYQSEKWLDESFGILGWSYGAMVRGESQKPGGQAFYLNDGTFVPSSYSEPLMFNGGKLGGMDLSIGVRVQWDLGARQATIGTPEWARKILSDNAPVIPGSADAAFQARYPTLDSKYEAFGEPAKYSSQASFFGSRVSSTSLSPVTGFTEVWQDANGKDYDRYFDTWQENVSGYGIPSMSKYSTFAALGSRAAQQGVTFSPQYTTSSRGDINDVDYAFAVAGAQKNPIHSTFVVNDSKYSNMVNDYLNTEKYWGTKDSAYSGNTYSNGVFNAPVTASSSLLSSIVKDYNNSISSKNLSSTILNDYKAQTIKGMGSTPIMNSSLTASINNSSWKSYNPSGKYW